MNIEELRLRSFDMWFSLIAAILIFAGTFKLVGDVIALLFTNDGNFEGLKDFGPFFRTLLLSWVSTLGLLIFFLPKAFKTRENKVSMLVGVISASVIIVLIVRFFGFDFLLGGPGFDLKLDYLDILRNLLMGGVIIGTLKWLERQHSAQQ